MTEVLDTIAPPYSAEFVQLFLPLAENDEILGGIGRMRDSGQGRKTTFSRIENVWLEKLVLLEISYMLSGGRLGCWMQPDQGWQR